MLQILLVLCSHKYTVELRRDPATAYRNKQPKSKEKGWPGAKTSQPVSAGSRGNRRRWAALRDEGRLPGRWPCLRCSCSPRLGRAAAFGSGPTALYRHAAFFDRDGDGVVSLAETYGAFRALGFGFSVSSVSAALINGALGSKCRPENATSSKLDIYIEDIQRGKHGSDTGSYDAEGRFVPEKFEEIFAKHARTVPDALTSDEIDQMLEANREPGDYSGWAAAEAEWKILYSLGKDQDGLLRKDVARGVYDGTLFHRLAPDWKSPQKLSVIREN
ncbi:hypothetical protein U9M48_022058 [Paspalum notatum var. saurae]|uniref:EF-hand domain-containing protein n=1 Tax=Paspalum notatum var. saurae TaxID=547442 RepID=A0AAQ3WTM7_PASNO